jgi:hypothetical protein
MAGNYSSVRDIVWGRVSHVVWLDLPRSVVMRQVIARSLVRAVWPADVFPGCRENLQRMLIKDHPIRFAWDRFEANRTKYAALFADPAYAHITRIRCRSRRDANAALDALIREARA